MFICIKFYHANNLVLYSLKITTITYSLSTQRLEEEYHLSSGVQDHFGQYNDFILTGRRKEKREREKGN